MTMHPNKISPDDPRLTAYALGELAGDEQAAVAAAVRADPTLPAVVDEIRATARQMSEALEAEPVVAAEAEPFWPEARLADRNPRKVKAFPYWLVTLGATACFGAFFIVWQRDYEARPEATRTVQHVAKTPARGGFAVEGNVPAPALELVRAEESVEDRFFATNEAARSSLPLRVGRGSFDDVRARLRRGERPWRSEVRVSELVNAFSYRWPAPRAGESFAVVLEEAAAPWAHAHRLVRVGVKARDGSGELLAADAQVAVEFNPARVRAWRLIGFERNNGAVGVHSAGPAGENLGAGYALVALYEVVPAGKVESGKPKVEMNPLLTLRLDYREPESGAARGQIFSLAESGTEFAEASEDFKLAASVAAFGMVLQDSPLRGTATLADVARWAGATSAAMQDSASTALRQATATRVAGNLQDQRTELLNLVRQAEEVLR